MSENLKDYTCECGFFLLSRMDGGIQLSNFKHTHNKCGPCNTYGVFIDNEVKRTPTLTEAYQQGRDDEYESLLPIIQTLEAKNSMLQNRIEELEKNND